MGPNPPVSAGAQSYSVSEGEILAVAASRMLPLFFSGSRLKKQDQYSM